LFDRIRDCIGDLTAAEKSIGDASRLSHYARRVQSALQKIAAKEPVGFDETDLSIIKAGVKRLESLSGTIDEAMVRDMLDTMLTTASAVARYELQEKQEERINGAGDVRKAKAEPPEITEARREIAKLVDRPGGLTVEKLTSSLDRVIARTWITETRKWMDPNLTREERLSVEGLRFAYGAPYSAEIHAPFSNDLSQLREWLLNRIDQRPVHGDCRLREEVWSIPMPQENGIDDPRFVTATWRLVNLLRRHLIDCLCAALNPPCPPCEDPGVKLACLDVDDCEVIYICNLERTYVLSAVAFRYWLPLLHQIGEFLEKFCCEWPRHLTIPPREKPKREYDPQLRYFVDTLVKAPPELTDILKVVGINEDTARSTINLGGYLAALGRTDPAFHVELQRLMALTTEASGKLSQAAVRATDAQRINELTEELNHLRARVDSLEGKRGGRR
jgi:hypothetical protein